MEKETAVALVQAIANAFQASGENLLRLTALELVLKERDPYLHSAYLQKIESLRNHRAVDMTAQGFEGLVAKLTRS